MLNIAICDDDSKQRYTIESYFDKLNKSNIEWWSYDSAEKLYDTIKLKEMTFDIFILDVEMGNMSGIELAKKIRENDKNAIIIFLTSYTAYALDVFEVVTFDFLIKPLTYEKFQEVINNTIEYMSLTKKTFSFEFKKDFYNIPYNNIVYIDKLGRKAFTHTIDGKRYECNLNMKQVWERLNEKMFVSLCKSCIINVSKIKEIEKEKVKLEGNIELNVSREYRTALKKKHLDYYKEQI